jgi:hypothetical protein
MSLRCGRCLFARGESGAFVQPRSQGERSWRWVAAEFFQQQLSLLCSTLPPLVSLDTKKKPEVSDPKAIKPIDTKK